MERDISTLRGDIEVAEQQCHRQAAQGRLHLPVCGDLSERLPGRVKAMLVEQGQQVQSVSAWQATLQPTTHGLAQRLGAMVAAESQQRPDDCLQAGLDPRLEPIGFLTMLAP
jgi:hypothetical protein